MFQRSYQTHGPLLFADIGYISFCFFLLFCDSEFNCAVKMSERVKDCPMGKSEKNKWRHLSLSVAQKVELLQ